MSMKSFIQRMINTHGVDVTYRQVLGEAYDVNTSSISYSTVDHSLKTYPKPIRANMYNQPSLIGKLSFVFYFEDLPFKPEVQDKIIMNSKEFSVKSHPEHILEGTVHLYKVTGVYG